MTFCHTSFDNNEVLHSVRPITTAFFSLVMGRKWIVCCSSLLSVITRLIKKIDVRLNDSNFGFTAWRRGQVLSKINMGCSEYRIRDQHA